MYIEVFKTNVGDGEKARQLLMAIHSTFIGYMANFDLADCDRILRVVCVDSRVDNDMLIDFLRNRECEAEVLLDTVPLEDEKSILQLIMGD